MAVGTRGQSSSLECHAVTRCSRFDAICGHNIPRTSHQSDTITEVSNLTLKIVRSLFNWKGDWREYRYGVNSQRRRSPLYSSFPHCLVRQKSKTNTWFSGLTLGSRFSIGLVLFGADSTPGISNLLVDRWCYFIKTNVCLEIRCDSYDWWNNEKRRQKLIKTMTNWIYYSIWFGLKKTEFCGKQESQC